MTIEPDEGVEQIQARLARARSHQVYLYLPRANETLRHRLPLTLLRRTADDLGLNLTVVTRDSATRVMAGNVGLRAQWRMEGGKKWKMEDGKWKMGGGERKMENGQRFKSTPVPSPIHPPSSVLHSPSSILHSPFSFLALAVVLLVLGLTLAVVVLPHATVIVAPLTVPIETTVEIEADPGLTTVDISGRRIPARRLEVTLDRQAREPTSARTDVPDAPARGTVVFINQSETEVVIPTGAMISGSEGVAFRTREAVTVKGPAGTTARVPVEAVKAGPEGNVPAYTINVLDPSLGLPVAAVNDRPMSGGTVRRVGIVTQEERDRVRDALLDHTRQAALQALKAQVREGETLIDDTLQFQVVGESFSEQAESVADVITVDLTVRAVGTAVNLDQARQLAEEVLRRGVPAEQVLVGGSLQSNVGRVLRDEGGGAHIQVGASATAQARIREGDIKDVVRGRPVDEAVILLRERFPLAAEPIIDVSRGWLGRIPWLSMRIDVVIWDDSTLIG
ncbi:MAG: baseplate J/gp47 family protein [Anaerolineae bacterium]